MPEHVNIGVIAAAGKGTRAYPRTTQIHKTVFEIQGKTLLHHNAEILVKQLGVQKIYVIAGHLEAQVRAAVKKISVSDLKVDIEVINWTRRGLAADVASLSDKISEPFQLILGDEFYYKPDFSAFLQFSASNRDFEAAIGYVHTPFVTKIRKNYSVLLEGDRIKRLVEKPADPPNDMLGVGSYLLKPSYFEFFRKTPQSHHSGVVEITYVLDRMAQETGKVFAVPLTCDYFNINTMQDYHQAVYEVRNDQFDTFSVSLIIPGGKHAALTGDVVEDFKDKVREIVVLDGAFTGEQVMNGFDRATGDLLVLVSPDGAFRSKDLPKLLEYMKDSDMVIGTRVTRQMIEQGSNVRPFVRLVNLFLGKLVDVFWWGQQPRFTDVDCRYLCIWKDAYLGIRPQLSHRSKFPVVELMIEVVRHFMRCVEIPVSYHTTQETEPYSFWKTCKNAISIGWIIIRKKIEFSI
ncbi:MAG TPA: sugar phosphate nucleotidyltransferase [Candidatus Methylomirabilis sp.]|nr:sugar phosphate nucleotidyltransferase [Candidatus Methylomirabilis sp.]